MTRFGLQLAGSLCLLTTAFPAAAEDLRPPPSVIAEDAPPLPVAEAPRHPRNAITLGPLSWIPALIGVGNFNVEYERGLTRQMSLFVAPEVQFGELSGTATQGATTYRLFAVGAWAGMRFFPLGDDATPAPKGFWIGPAVRGAYNTVTVAGITATGYTASVGAQLGYTFLIGDAFDLSLGGGGGITYGNVRVGDISANAVSFAFPYLARVNVGYAF